MGRSDWERKEIPGRCVESLRSIHAEYAKAVANIEDKPGLSYIHSEEMEYWGLRFKRDAQADEKMLSDRLESMTVKGANAANNVLRDEYGDYDDLLMRFDEKVKTGRRLHTVWYYFRHFPSVPALFAGLTRRHVGQLEAAEKELKNGIKLWPRQSNLFYELSETLKASGEYDEAMFYVEEGLSRDEHSPRLYLQKSFLLGRQGNYDESLHFADEAFSRNLDDEGKMRFGLFLWDHGNEPRAVSILTELIEKGVKDPVPYAKLIEYHLNRSEKGEAEEVIKRFSETEERMSRENMGPSMKINFASLSRELSKLSGIWRNLQENLFEVLQSDLTVPIPYKAIRISFWEDRYFHLWTEIFKTAERKALSKCDLPAGRESIDFRRRKRVLRQLCPAAAEMNLGSRG